MRPTYDPRTHRPLTFHDATSRFTDGTDSPTDYLERCLATIEEREPEVQAWQAMRLDAARTEAALATRRWRAGSPLSPIDGMPVGIKDLIQTYDLPTGEGIVGNERAQSLGDSASVQALRAAGAVIVGKLVTTELGGGTPSKTRNPFDLRRTPGGSSSGCGAAIGARMLPAAIGTQVGGSILRPAGYCANFASKPTFGALHRGERQSSSQSCIGVHAGSLQDLWNVTHAMASRTGGDPGHPGLFGPQAPPGSSRPQRLAVMECTGWAATDLDTRHAFEALLQQMRDQGIEVIRRDDHPALEAFEQSLARASSFVGTILDYENRWYVENLARRLRTLAPSTLRSLERARRLTVDDYRHALQQRRVAQECFSAVAALANALVSPSAPAPAPFIDGAEPLPGQPIYVATGDPAYNLPASLLLAPALTLPLIAVRGMPVGLQLIGQPHQDWQLGAIGQWLMGHLEPVSAGT